MDYQLGGHNPEPEEELFRQIYAEGLQNSSKSSEQLSVPRFYHKVSVKALWTVMRGFVLICQYLYVF